MELDLFGIEEQQRQWREDLYPDAIVLRRLVVSNAEELLLTLQELAGCSPFRETWTPGGAKMSVHTTGCGAYGELLPGRTDGARSVDPVTNQPWPALPDLFYELGVAAAREAGFPDFVPNSAHINRYAIGAKLGLHQDKRLRESDTPIVSVSLGLPAIFMMGGFERNDAIKRIPLGHGDVVVWGGSSRMRFHGVAPIKPGQHPLTGEYRFNITIREML